MMEVMICGDHGNELMIIYLITINEEYFSEFVCVHEVLIVFEYISIDLNTVNKFN